MVMASRTSYSKRNIYTGFGGKLITFAFAFSTRTVFARLLGTEYTGVDGLYSNILNLLTLADLGIGNVFEYSLYQGLADGDEDKIASLVQSFRKLYIMIGTLIFGVGIFIIPFLPWLVNTNLPQDKVILYYVLYLSNTAVTYFFSYRITVLQADQKQYISNVYTLLFQILMYLAQLFYLLLLGDFTGYLIIMVLCTIGNNVVLSVITGKRYPYLKKKVLGGRPEIDRKKLWTNVKATFIYRVSAVTINCTDSILISVMIGTVFVGKYAYYYLLIQYVIAYVRIFGKGILASIGNLQTEHDERKSLRFLETLNLTYVIIAILMVTAYANCIQYFIVIWVGEAFLLDYICVIAVMMSAYLEVIFYPVLLYRESMGLFREVQNIQIPAAIINLILSVLLGEKMGLAGILFATSIAKITTIIWYEPMIVYKKLGRSVKEYYLKEAGFLATCLLCMAVTGMVCHFLPATILGVLWRFFSSVLLSFGCIWMIYRRTEAWKDLHRRVRALCGR